MQAFVKRKLPAAPEPTKTVRIDPKPDALALFEWPELAKKARRGAAESRRTKEKEK